MINHDRLLKKVNDALKALDEIDYMKVFDTKSEIRASAGLGHGIGSAKGHLQCIKIDLEVDQAFGDNARRKER